MPCWRLSQWVLMLPGWPRIFWPALPSLGKVPHVPSTNGGAVGCGGWVWVDLGSIGSNSEALGPISAHFGPFPPMSPCSNPNHHLMAGILHKKHCKQQIYTTICSSKEQEVPSYPFQWKILGLTSLLFMGKCVLPIFLKHSRVKFKNYSYSWIFLLIAITRLVLKPLLICEHYSIYCS